jgi:hypothetical protein
MRIYEGSPRQDFEEVLRSVGAYFDDRGLREILFVETEDGFIVQGLVIEGSTSSWSDSMGQSVKQTLTLLDDEINQFMDDAVARRGAPPKDAPDHYESALRVIGRYLDEQHPRDIFFFEQDGSYVIRLLKSTSSGIHHELVEFTREDIADLIARAPALRRGVPASAQ